MTPEEKGIENIVHQTPPMSCFTRYPIILSLYSGRRIKSILPFERSFDVLLSIRFERSFDDSCSARCDEGSTVWCVWFDKQICVTTMQLNNEAPRIEVYVLGF
jgi:hypothetical protein